MNPEDFHTWSRRAADWSAQYMKQLPELPVRAQTQPGEIAAQVAEAPPENAEPMETIFADFERIVPPGMTHWQHPRFFAYFCSNAAPAAIIAEQLAAAMSAQCMLWQTSPAATELEQCMVDWLRQAVGLPARFSGTLQDTASMSNLAAVLTMRERTLEWAGNKTGLAGKTQLRIYASNQIHSSVDKAIWVAGIGQDNLVKIPVDDGFAMRIDALRAAIRQDRADGYLPAGVVASVGGTSIGGTDDIRAVCSVAKEEDLYSHVDAAWAGSAMICPEFRHYWDGAELADSIVINPHKWLGASMECSLHLVSDPDLLLKTLSIQPEYLRTHGKDGVVNFSEWSLQLGRRFRALKVWFLLRSYGLEGLRTIIRNHVKWSQSLAESIRSDPQFQIVTEPMLSLFSFRYAPPGTDDLDALNIRLVNAINDDGRIYLTQSIHQGKIVIRFQAGTHACTEEDVAIAWQVIQELAAKQQ